MSAERKRFDKKWKGRAYPEVIAEDVAELKARLAALEKCIEARDALIAQAYGDLSTDPESCDCLDCKLRVAIRRADEEAGRP